MAKYAILDISNYELLDTNDKLSMFTLILFRNESQLLDSITIPKAEFNESKLDEIIDKALKQRPS